MSREEHKDAIEVSIIFHEGQRMFAVPKQPAPMLQPNRVIAYSAAIKLRELGYEWMNDEWKHLDELAEQPAQPAQQEPVGEVSGHDWSTGILYRDLEPGAPLYTSPQPAQPLPFGVGGGLVAIKTLLSRDPCGHANTAIQMIDAILAEQPAPIPWRRWDYINNRAITMSTSKYEALCYLLHIKVDDESFDLGKAIDLAIEAKLKEKNT